MSWTPERRQALAALLDQHLSYSKAAQRLGVHRGSVCWATARYGIGREPANLSRATGKVRGEWSEERLTERWSDRRRARG